MDAIVRTRPAGRWLDRSVTTAYTRPLVLVAVLSLAYYTTAVFGYASLMIPGLPTMAVLWPPNVFLLVAFLATPFRLWPLIVAFAFVTQLAVAATVGIPIGRSLAMFTGNLSQPLLAASIL